MTRHLAICLAAALLWLAGGCARPDFGADGNNPGDKGDKSAYKAPLLSSVLDGGVRNLAQTNLDFGQSVQGVLEGGFPFAGFQFDALPGARVTIWLKAVGSAFDPVLVLYGPRTYQGGFSTTLVTADDWGDGKDAVIPGFLLAEGGQYLVLAASYDNTTGGAFSLSLGCTGLCQEPPCPDTLCDLFCGEGYLLDTNGCYACACKQATAAQCLSDADCGMGQSCISGQCTAITDACPCESTWDPVCGVDGATYANACEIQCFDVDIAYSGQCQDPSWTTCTSNADCPSEYTCSDGVCVLAAPLCQCSSTWEPLCGADGITYANHCELECAGVSLGHRGQCEGNEASCMPVCYTESTDANITQGSVEGYFDSCTGVLLLAAPCTQCADEQPTGSPPCQTCFAICGDDTTGVAGWYDSCTGYLILATDCASQGNCGCQQVYDPVCGADGQTYDNICLLQCANATAGQWVDVSYGGSCSDVGSEGCTASNECPSGFYCSAEGYYGIPQGGQDLPADPSEPGVCLPLNSLACQSDSDCPTGYLCSAEVGICVSEESTDGCIVTGCFQEICADHRVQTSCDTFQTPFVCLSMALCERQSNGSCGFSSTADYQSCMSGFDDGGPCAADSDCAPGESCLSGYCAANQCVCGEENLEVCSVTCQTYANPCELACDGGTMLHVGPCTATNCTP